MAITYTIPTIGTTPDPQWESLIVTALAAIQSHTHDGVNAGSKILPTAVDFTNAGFNFGNQPQTNASYLDVAQQSSAPANTAGHGRFYCDTSGNLFYISPSTNVKLASATAINYSAASLGFLGDYGNTGGAAYYNAASGTWPQTSTCFFYTSTSTPTNDTGSRAGLGAALLDLKGNQPKVYLKDSGGGTLETSQWGIIGVSSGYGSFGITVRGLDSSGAAQGANSSVPYSLFPTLAARSVTENVAGTLKTWGLHVNGSVPNGTASEIFAHSVKTTSLGNSSPAEGSYWVAQSTTGSAPQAPAAGYGYRHRMKAAFQAGTGVYADVADQAMLESYWISTLAVSNKCSGYRWFLSSGSISATPAFDSAWNSATTGMTFGIGVAANLATSQLLMGVPLNMGSHAITGISGGITIDSGGMTITSGNLATMAGNIAVTGNVVASGVLDVTGAATLRSTLTVLGATSLASFTPTATAVAPTNGTGGLFKNTQVLGFANVSAAGVITNGYGISSASWASATCTLSLTNTITKGVCLVSLSTGASGHGAVQGLCGTVDATVFTWDGTGGSVAQPFSIVIIGQP